MPKIYNKTISFRTLAISKIQCVKHKRVACTDRACVNRLAERLGERALRWKSAIRPDIISAENNF